MMFSIAIFGSFRFSFNLSRLEEVFKKLKNFWKFQGKHVRRNVIILPEKVFAMGLLQWNKKSKTKQKTPHLLCSVDGTF